MAREPTRDLTVYAKRGSIPTEGRVELVMLKEGERIDSVSFTIQQAEQHIRHVQAAVDIALGRTKAGLILPEGVKVN